MAGITKKQLTDFWAYDLAQRVMEHGEVLDVDVIDQSIELILTTRFTERLFNLTYGCNLYSYVFRGITQGMGEELLDHVISCIRKWEDRITVLDKEARLIVNEDEHRIILIIPYIVNRTGIGSIFKKKIITS